MAKRNKDTRSMLAYVGFVDYRPHVQLANGAGGPRTVECYISKAAAKRAYMDVRTVRLVFDSNWRQQLPKPPRKAGCR